MGNDLVWGCAMTHQRAAVPIADRRRGRRCSCGCRQRSTHMGAAGGVVLVQGCELAVRRWVRTAEAPGIVGARLRWQR